MFLGSEMGRLRGTRGGGRRDSKHLIPGNLQIADAELPEGIHLSSHIEETAEGKCQKRGPVDDGMFWVVMPGGVQTRACQKLLVEKLHFIFVFC